MPSTTLYRHVWDNAQGRCSKCGRHLAQRTQRLRYQRIAHIWKKDGNPQNLSIDNLGVMCNPCHDKLKPPVMTTTLRYKVWDKAEGKCERCGKKLVQKRKYAGITRYDKVTREKAHVWRKDGRMRNIDMNNLELVCNTCRDELKTTVFVLY